MNEEITLFPEQLSDEAAFALSEVLHWLALTCDEKYFAQIRRHMVTLNKRQDTHHLCWVRSDEQKTGHPSSLLGQE
ncbi:MAG: hypothetical protein ABW168_15205 [Sedimenticola sp.]